MEALAKIFGSPARLKVLRLFLFNIDSALSLKEVAIRAKLSSSEARKEVAALAGADLLRRKLGKEIRYLVNPKFEHLVALEQFVRATTAVQPEELLARLKKAGTLRLVVLSGLFTGAGEAKADLLIVGDTLNERALKQATLALEAELGREIRYAVLATADFRYRMGVYDRLIRDVLDYPHRILLDKIGL